MVLRSRHNGIINMTKTSYELISELKVNHPWMREPRFAYSELEEVVRAMASAIEKMSEEIEWLKNEVKELDAECERATGELDDAKDTIATIRDALRGIL